MQVRCLIYILLDKMLPVQCDIFTILYICHSGDSDSGESAIPLMEILIGAFY